jgi:hypothetical protein
MSDIVERLRKVDFETRPFWSSNTIRDAIAEIATLSAKLAETERERDRAHARFICVPAECDPNCDIPDCPYTHSPLTWRDKAEAAEAKLAEAERERDAVREQHKDFVVAVLGQSREECLAAGPRDEHDDFLAHIKKLREQAARVAELEKALEPFAEAAETAQKLADLHGANEFVLSFGPAPIGAIPLWCFIEARAALAATKEPTPCADIPRSVMEEARDVWFATLHKDVVTNKDAIVLFARALLARDKRAAGIARNNDPFPEEGEYIASLILTYPEGKEDGL